MQSNASGFVISARRLLAGALVAALSACSGGGGTPVAPISSATSRPAGTFARNGTVVIPSGVNVAATSLTVANSLSSTVPSSNGSFTLDDLGGLQFAIVRTRNGNTFLEGFIGPGATTLDSTSTAKALVFFAARFYALPDPYRAQSVDAIASQPGFSNVVAAVEGALRANPDAFGSANPAVASAVKSMVATVYQRPAAGLRRSVATLRHTQTVGVTPSDASGITVVNDFPSGIHFLNTYRRLAKAFIDEDSYVDASNARISKPVVDAAPLVVIPPTSGVGSFTGTLVSIVQNYFTGATAYTPVETASVALALEPGSKSTRYNVTVVGGSANPLSQASATLSLTKEQRDAQATAVLQQLLQDIIAPLVTAVLVPINGDTIDKLFKIDGVNNPFADVIGLLLSTTPQVLDSIAAGNLNDAAYLVYNTILGSSSVQTAFFVALNGLLVSFFERSGVVQPAFANLITSRFASSAQSTLSALNLAGAVLTSFDLLTVGGAFALSNAADRFTVDVIADRATLTPASSQVATTATQDFTASVPSATGSGETIVWNWTCTAKNGHIADGQAGHTDMFTSSKNVVTYTANPTVSGDGSDTITAQAFLVSGQNRIALDTATAKVTVFAATVALAPQTSQPLANDATQTYTVSVKNAPPGVPLSYTWTNTATAGTLTGSNGTNTFTGPDTSVTYTASHTGIGTDTIVVEVNGVVNGTKVSLGSDVAHAVVKGNATLAIAPASSNLKNDGTQTLTANVTNPPQNATLTYTWSNPAAVGHLQPAGGGASDSFTTASPVAIYTASHSGSGTDLVTVGVVATTASGATVSLGTATASLAVNSNALCNGDFSGGLSCWGFSGSGSKYSVETYANCQPSQIGNPFGSIDLLFGGSATGTLSQSFTIPIGAKTLVFRAWGQLDAVMATVNIVSGGATSTLATFTPPTLQASETTCSGAVPLQERLDVSAFAGKSVTLQLFIHDSTGYDGDIAQFDDFVVQ